VNLARTTLISLAAAAALLCGAAFAETYDPSGDRYVGAPDRGPTKSVLPIETVEYVTYVKMPEIRQRIERNTGKSITYSLVFVQVGPDVMAVDPFRFNR
jgi:hypothetical protein